MANTDKGKYRILLHGIMILLLCAIIAVQVLAQEQNRDEMKPSATGWQHLAFTNTIGETPMSELAGSINKLGREGWEMVSVGNIIESGTTTKTIFYFKKPL
ncbi:hypothetical protein ACFL5Z_18980 [Planctomycetota bacterium]